MRRNFKNTEVQAYMVAQIAVFEFLSCHEGHGISPSDWQNIRAIVHGVVADAAFESRSGMSFSEMLQLARALADAELGRLLGEEGEGGLAVLPLQPEDDRGSGGALVAPEYDCPAVDIDELRRLACAVAARACYDPRYREDAIAAATDDGVLYAWQHYDPARGPLVAWVAVCAHYHALAVVREATRTGQREPLDGSPELAHKKSGKGREIDKLMMKTMDGLARTGLTPREYAAYIRCRLGLPAGNDNQRNALRLAKKKLKTVLEQSGYSYEDFFLAA